jgi:hypothetical protein
MKTNNHYRHKSLVFALIAQILILAVGTSFFGTIPSVDGGTFYICELVGVTLMVCAAAIEKITTSRLLFVASAFVIFLGAFLAPALNSIYGAALLSSGLALFAIIYTAAFEHL